MIPNRSQFGEMRLAAHQPDFSQREMEETFLKLCDLLEEYAPAWYSDQLCEKTESVRRRIGK